MTVDSFQGGSQAMSTPNPVTIGDVSIGRGRPLALIGGPCVMEPNDLTLTIARRLVAICGPLGVPLIFKASFDKANRTSQSSYRGPGLHQGLKVFERVKAETGLAVTTDVHETHQAEPLAEVVDLLQIPAFLARQTDLLEAAAATGRPLNVKKGQFLAPWDMAHVVAKVASQSTAGVLLTERGTTFGYGRLVNDFRAIPQMQATGAPVVFDATHSVQLPGAGPGGAASAGERDMIPYLARAAVAAGCDALFLEVHPRPEQALSDGPNALRLDDLPTLLATCLRIRAAITGGGSQGPFGLS
jgi:2-dehydro-3-deoxyphosphooctonate aldolase (KDO 8-P synthase)